MKASRCVGFLFPALFFLLGLAAAEERGGETGDGRVVLAKVRLALGGDLFEWTASGLGPVGGAAAETGAIPLPLKPETLLSFLNLTPGARYSPDDLAQRCSESEARLAESTLVYEARVDILPPRRDPGSRTVLVSVSPGFLWRFGGGNAYGSLGHAAIRGERFSIRAYFGWNRNGAELLHERVGGLPFVLGAGCFADAPGLWPGALLSTGLPADKPVLEGRLTQGYYFGPDLLLALDEAVSGTVISLQPYLRFAKPLPGSMERERSSHIGGEARLWWFLPETRSVKVEGSVWHRKAVGERSTLAIKAGAGDSAGAFGFDLHQTEDRSVRSGYPQSSLSASRFALLSAEGRYRALVLPLRAGIACDLEPFIFVDAAVFEASEGDGRQAEAGGFGLRLLVDSPVFAYVSLTYGMNREGSGRFTLCGTAGF